MRKTSKHLAAALGILVASVAFAHEFWIQPDSFRSAIGAPTSLRLLVGDGFPGERRSRDAKKLERFDVIGPEAGSPPVAIEGEDGGDPVGSIVPTRPGVYAVSYCGRESTIVLEAAKFEEYLREEGLDSVLRQRAEASESNQQGREAYSRCAKSLLCVGGDPSGAWNARTGLSVEIIPVTNPYTAHAGDEIAFTLLRDGKPLANAQLTALVWDKEQTLRTAARTDASGKASFSLKQPGMWLINAVVMERANTRSERNDVDWVSVWSSLTFDLAPAEADRAEK